MTSRRKFLTTAGAGLAGAAHYCAHPQSMFAPNQRLNGACRPTLGVHLSAHVIKPAIDSFNKIAGSEMQIELFLWRSTGTHR